MQLLMAKYVLIVPLITLLIFKHASIKKTTGLLLNSLVMIGFISLSIFAKQKFFYTLGLEQNFFFIYMIIFATVVAISTEYQRRELLAFCSCIFLIAIFFVNEVMIFFPIIRIYIDYSLLQNERFEANRASMFNYRMLANICEVALLFVITSFEFSRQASQVLSLGIFFIFVFQIVLSYFYEKCFCVTLTPLRIMGNFVNYFLYPGWALMLMRQVKYVETLTSLSVFVLALGVFIILLDVYFSKKSIYAILVVNILLFFCPIKGNEYIFYKLSSYSFMGGLFILWTQELLALATSPSRIGKTLHYIFIVLVAMPILGNGNLVKFIILLRLHKEHLAIYLITLLGFMLLQAFYRFDTTTSNPKVLIKKFQPFLIIIVTNILVTIALNLSLLGNAKI